MAETGLLSGIVQLAVGAKQKKKASEIDTARPEYKIPKEVFQNQSMYESMANSSRVPGQSYIENQIGQNAANALGASQKVAGSSAEALSAISGIQQNTNNQINQLAQQGAQYQFINKDKLAAANQNVADYREKAFDMNQYQPYMMRLAEKKKLQQAAWDNAQTGANQIAGVGDQVGKSMMGI